MPYPQSPVSKRSGLASEMGWGLMNVDSQTSAELVLACCCVMLRKGGGANMSISMDQSTNKGNTCDLESQECKEPRDHDELLSQWVCVGLSPCQWLFSCSFHVWRSPREVGHCVSDDPLPSVPPFGALLHSAALWWTLPSQGSPCCGRREGVSTSRDTK